jgi:acyl carrier protein
MTQQSKIIEIVQRLSGKKETPEEDESLFESGYLDSFGLADLIGEIERDFGVNVPDSDLTPRTFESIRKIERYIDLHKNDLHKSDLHKSTGAKGR